MAPIRLLIVDDHTLFRQGLVSLLQSEPDLQVVGEAADGDDGLWLAQQRKPDVVLMDVKMPRLGGVEATRRLLAMMPLARVVMLTISEEDEDLLAAIQAGAQGYILKNADADELLAAIRRVHAGEAMLSPAVTARLLKMVRGERQAAVAELPLTVREQQVLRLLAQGASNQQIADALTISENTVKTHVRHILDKLDLRSRAEVLAYARRLNLAP